MWLSTIRLPWVTAMTPSISQTRSCGPSHRATRLRTATLHPPTRHLPSLNTHVDTQLTPLAMTTAAGAERAVWANLGRPCWCYLRRIKAGWSRS
ncbi:hypothetical protein B0H14DRAFT_3038998 [Mycena olivaceomarginata]|nr:hypothetical protein B0H14DRAFT_3038998 [Mycena olivaceomarginata]